MKSVIFSAAAVLLAQAVSALAPLPPLVKRGGIKAQVHPDLDIIGNGTFHQLLDHKDPSKGTFKQRFWWDAQNWKGPGSPIFLMNAGEDDADGYLGYLHNKTLPGMYAQMFEGAVILIEHRYWGESIPFDTLTAETLQYHDLPNAIADMTYFAKNVKLEFDDSNQSNADKAPWVLMGGSYPGALAAWVQQKDPGTFWAYHSSSGVVQTITHFWEYYVPIEAALPRNCSADVKAVISYVDHVLSTGSDDEIATLKAYFGLDMLDHHDDFAELISNPLSQWQEKPEDVFAFCDYIEGGDSGIISTHAGGVGLSAALPRYGNWVKQTVGEKCTQYNCDTYTNTDAFNRPEDFTHMRQWDWLLCHNPFSWWQTGPDKSDGTNIVSVFNTVEHWTRLCALKFPATNGFISGAEEGFTAEHLDMYTNGWDGSFERVLFVNGEVDPWIEATVSSQYRPGGPVTSSAKTPVFVIKNGNHCPEMVIGETAEALDVYEDMFKVMDGWLKEWGSN